MGLQLHGVVPPVITPLRADETVDEAGLERQLQRLMAAGVHGFFLLGSTGEQPALRDEERRRVLRHALAVVGGRVPVVVGTMASSTARCLEYAREAAAAGADAVAVTPPYYFPSRGEADQLAHYRALAEGSPVPVVIYNIPSTTKVMVSAATMARIAEHRNVVGIKDSSGDMAHFLRVLELLGGREDFSVLIGLPPLAAPALLIGAVGCVPGISNIDPALMVGLYQAATSGNTTALPGMQRRVHRLMDLVALGAPIACLKTALQCMGVCEAHTCAPLQPLSATAREQVAAILSELELIA